MRTISQEEYKKLYGEDSLAQFNQPAQQTQTGGYGQGVSDAFSAGLKRIGQGVQEANPMGNGGVGGLVTGVGKILGGAAGAITSPIAPALDATLGKAVNYVGDKISNIPAVQKFAMSPAGEKTAKVAETVGDYANAAGLVAGGIEAAPRIGSGLKAGADAVSARVDNLAAKTEGITSHLKSVIKDQTGTFQRHINSQISQALELTPGDLSNISKSTGNDVGTWMSDHNLIGTNKETTQANIKSFKDQNYKSVRDEIGKVDKTYKQNQVPRYVDALKQVQRQVEGIPGLEQTAVDVDNLLNMKKENITLSDVQKVKELLDDNFSLYKATGDVKDSAVKEGLAIMRGDLKGFIEKEVKDNTGADIEQMNNNVATAKSLGDAIETRDPKGLTRSGWARGDTALSFFAISNPAVGIPAFIFKKLYESPTTRLKVARWLDQLSDAQRAKLQSQLKQGQAPVGLKKAADITGSEEQASPKAIPRPK